MRPGQRDSNDLTSLEMRVVEKNPDDGLKLFEMPEDPSGRGFTLVNRNPDSTGMAETVFASRNLNGRHAWCYKARLRARVKKELNELLRIGRTTSWASFSNPGAVMNTTMPSERWHLCLKYEILLRNANTRVDFLVELLIRAVEDLAESNDIMDRRRLATASFRTQQTTARHRSALTHYEGKMEKIRRITMQKWEVQGKTPQVTYIVENRGSYNLNVPAVVHEQDEEEPASSAAKENVMPVSSDPFVSSQERLDERKSLRNRIQLPYSVVSSNVNVLVKEGTDEAKEKVKEIADLIERASQICVGSSSQIAIRPRHTGEGPKPKQEKKLYTRAEYRRLRDADKDNDDQN
ncbi:hypothetical protein COOONC_19227 [Cooperia oncophora]